MVLRVWPKKMFSEKKTFSEAYTRVKVKSSLKTSGKNSAKNPSLKRLLKAS